jgi:hypothetical protein
MHRNVRVRLPSNVPVNALVDLENWGPTRMPHGGIKTSMRYTFGHRVQTILHSTLTRGLRLSATDVLGEFLAYDRTSSLFS